MTNETTFSGNLRDETSIINPVFTLEISNPSRFNYAYISDFGRYYFITDMISIRTGFWRIYLHVDVLESFANDIKNLNVIFDTTEENGKELYLNGDMWKTKVKEITEIKSFPSGLPDNGEFILITAGG